MHHILVVYNLQVLHRYSKFQILDLGRELLAHSGATPGLLNRAGVS
jgi:hypothetical protein